ncbi:AraC family transcriptional regulator [Hymenobacter saemangeumensis]
MRSFDTLPVSSLNLLLWAAGQQGADVTALQRAIGLDAATAANPDARIPIATIQKLWPLAIAATGNAYLDLHLGSLVSAGSIGILAYVLMHSLTLGAALQQLCRYQDIACMGVKTSLAPAAEEERGVWLKLELLSADIVYPQHVLNSELSVYLAAFEALTGQAVRPAAVRLAYPRPADSREHERVLGPTPLEFGAAETAILLPNEALALPIRNASPTLFALFEQHAAALLAQLPARPEPPLAERVRREIVKLLKGNVPTLAMVADRLHLGTRTLQLHLKEAGHSYQQLLEEVRRELALRHLQQPQQSTADIAFLLGYAEPSVFVRRFKQWTGQTPGAFRRAALQPAAKRSPPGRLYPATTRAGSDGAGTWWRGRRLRSAQ